MDENFKKEQNSIFGEWKKFLMENENNIIAEIQGCKKEGDSTNYAMDTVKQQDKLEQYWKDQDKEYIRYLNDLYQKDPSEMPSPLFNTHNELDKYLFSHKIASYAIYNMLEIAKKHSIDWMIEQNIIGYFVRALYIKSVEQTAKKDLSRVLIFSMFYQEIFMQVWEKYHKELLTSINTDVVLYRIRAFDTDPSDKTNDDKEIRKAPKDNAELMRCNKSKEPVLYLAESLWGAIEEVFKRKEDRSPYILVGEFKPVKQLNIFDIDNAIEKFPISEYSKNLSSKNIVEIYASSVFNNWWGAIKSIHKPKEELIYEKSSDNIQLLVQMSDELKLEPLHGVSWKSKRSNEKEKSYAFFNGDSTEFEVSEMYVMKFNENGDYERVE